MIHNYNANLDNRENRELLNKIFQIQLIKDRFYVPSDIQPNIFSHDLLFGLTKEGEGSANNMRQFTLPVEGIGAIYSGNSSGGALVSNGRLASHEAIYLEDENERGHAKRQTPFLGKRGEYSLANGMVGRGTIMTHTHPDGTVMTGATHTSKSKTIGKIKPLKKVGGASVAKNKPLKKVVPMKKLTGQFSILNKVL